MGLPYISTALVTLSVVGLCMLPGCGSKKPPPPSAYARSAKKMPVRNKPAAKLKRAAWPNKRPKHNVKPKLLQSAKRPASARKLPA